MLWHLVLVEDSASVWVKADGQEGRHHFGSFCAKTRGLLRHGNGMIADDAEVEFVGGGEGGVLEVDPVSECAEIVTEMRNARGLNTGEDHFWSRLWCGLW